MPDLSFLTPLGGTFAVLALLPLAVFADRDRRIAQIRTALGLASPSGASRAATAGSLALVPVLLGLAASQPVIESSRTRAERTDAEAYVVLDVSRSMFASAARGSPTRLDRAREVTGTLQRSLPEIRFGLAGFNETVLPYVLPTTDARVIDATLADSLAIEDGSLPPLSAFFNAELTTSFGALAAIPRANFFSPSAEKRAVVVLTDGEITEAYAGLARPFRRRPRTHVVAVRLWDEGERIYTTGVADAGYVPDARLTARLEPAIELVGGKVYAEGDIDQVRSELERFFGSGPTQARRLGGDRFALMPYVTLAAFFPLGFLVWRRSV